MSWGTAWRNSWSGTWGDGISLTVADAVHAETADSTFLATISLLIADTGITLTSDNNLLTQANNLSVSDAVNNHYGDSISLSQLGALLMSNTKHNSYVDALGYFVIPELRLNGTLFGNSGAVTVSGVQCAVFSGNNLHSHKAWGASFGTSFGTSWGSEAIQPAILQTSSIAISNGQISVQYAGFSYTDIGNNYLVIFYKPGPPRIGGGPYPAIMVDANA